jgi:hypothetical protein
MNWKFKAIIIKIFSFIPYGEKLYVILQKKYGSLTPHPKFRYKYIAKTFKILKQNNIDLNNKVIFEVGTGHFPIMPIIFFLCGAKKIYTYDLNRRLQFKYLKKTINYILEDKTLIFEYFLDFVQKDIFNSKIKILENLLSKSIIELEDMNIFYKAPGDAAFVELPSDSIDIHFSCTVFEHIPFEVLDSIINESQRLLKQGGISFHLIDPSDHFAHQDRSITNINFLKYSNNVWNLIAGNDFAYCNRLRFSSYSKLFKKYNFKIIFEEKVVDERSLIELQKGFKFHTMFDNYSLSELSTIEYNIIAINQLNCMI